MPKPTNSFRLKDGPRGSLSAQSPQNSQPKDFKLLEIARVALLCSFALMSLAHPVLAQSSSWTAPYFLVQPMDPWASIKKANNGAIPADTSFKPFKDFVAEETPQSKQASVYFNEAGKIYASIGLKEPIFGPLFQSTSRFVFMFTFPGSLAGGAEIKDVFGAYFSTSCSTPITENWMALNTNTSGIDQYKTIAHELFHAIQDQSPFKKGYCKEVDWVDEGTADAAGFFLMEKKANEEAFPLPTGYDTKFYGVRPYDVPLYEDVSWNNLEVKKRFGPKISAYNSKAIYSHFGYRTSSFWRYLMDNYDNTLQLYAPKRLLALNKAVLNRPNPSTELYQDWVARGVGPSWGPFQHAYSQFLAEFAAWPGTKYPNLKIKDVLKDAFGGCEKKTLTPKKTSDTITLTPTSNTKFALHPIAGRCIQITVEGYKKGTKIKLALEAEVKPIIGNTVQAAVEAKDLADQLTLGFAREERSGTLTDNCYKLARGSKPQEDTCLLLGKVKKRKGKKPTNGIRTWRFAPRKVKDPTSTTTFILTNVAPLQASKTKGMTELDIRIALRVSQGRTDKGAQLDLPESFNLGELPDITIPRRQALYGIKKNSGVSAGYPMNLGVFQVAALDELGKKTETYALSPMEPVVFGQTGPFKAMLMVASNGGMSAGTMSTIGSQFCDTDSPAGNIGTITRSDYEILEISIDTPLCELAMTNLEACQGGCPVVDHFKGKLSIPFGWRYFGENEVEDLVTPGVLLDIDRYHYRVFGTPLQGLSGGSSNESGSGGGNANGGTASGNTSGSGTNQSETIQPCDCSCEAYEKLRKAKAEKDIDFMLGALTCTQQCRKPFRECRRAQKGR